jgi:pSer/pThr/pTyr-binding forkhead associated (FHA) protein
MEKKLYILSGPDKGKSFEIGFLEAITVGRSSLCDIQIKDDNISRFHIEIQKKRSKYFVIDLGSKNGTFIDGSDINPGMGVELKEGVPVVIGKSIIGLGDVCESSLKPFLDSRGICGEEVLKSSEVEKRWRAKAVKRNLGFIYNMNHIITDSMDINELSEKMLDNIFDFLKRIDRCVVILLNEKTGEISKIKYRSRKQVEDTEQVYNRELVQAALSLNKPVMVSNSYEAVDEDEKITESLQLMKIGSAMCVPMCALSKTRGVVYVDSLERPNGFRKNDLALLKDICNRAALAIGNIALNEYIGH